MSSFHTLKYIFLNRYRKLTFSDSGPFYFFGIIYLVSIYQLLYWENEYSLYIILIIFLLQNISFLQRNDFSFYRKQMGAFRAILLIKTDLLLISLPILSVSACKNISLLLIEEFFLLILPCFLILRKKNSAFIKLFSSNDPL